MMCGEISSFRGGEVVEEDWVGCGGGEYRCFFLGVGLSVWGPRNLGSEGVWRGGRALGEEVLGTGCDVFVDGGG